MTGVLLWCYGNEIKMEVSRVEHEMIGPCMEVHFSKTVLGRQYKQIYQATDREVHQYKEKMVESFVWRGAHQFYHALTKEWGVSVSDPREFYLAEL